MIKTIFIIGGVFLTSFAGFKIAGNISSLKQAGDNLIYKFKIDKWTVNSGSLGLKITATIINPDMNETFKFIYPQLLLLDENGYPFEASVIYDDTLKDKEYILEPRGQIIFDPFIIKVSISSMISILAKVVKANLSQYIQLSTQIASALITRDFSKIDNTQLNNLLSSQTEEINKNLKGRLLTRVNGINVSYDFELI